MNRVIAAWAAKLLLAQIAQERELRSLTRPRDSSGADDPVGNASWVSLRPPSNASASSFCRRIMVETSTPSGGHGERQFFNPAQMTSPTLRARSRILACQTGQPSLPALRRGRFGLGRLRGGRGGEEFAALRQSELPIPVGPATRGAKGSAAAPCVSVTPLLYRCCDYSRAGGRAK
jgi:hypothetical protein